jgi:hypothetical protein
MHSIRNGIRPSRHDLSIQKYKALIFLWALPYLPIETNHREEQPGRLRRRHRPWLSGPSSAYICVQWPGRLRIGEAWAGWFRLFSRTSIPFLRVALFETRVAEQRSWPYPRKKGHATRSRRERNTNPMHAIPPNTAIRRGKFPAAGSVRGGRNSLRRRAAAYPWPPCRDESEYLSPVQLQYQERAHLDTHDNVKFCEWVG